MYRALWSGLRPGHELWQLSWLHTWAPATVQRGFSLMHMTLTCFAVAYARRREKPSAPNSPSLAHESRSGKPASSGLRLHPAEQVRVYEANIPRSWGLCSSSSCHVWRPTGCSQGPRCVVRFECSRPVREFFWFLDEPLGFYRVWCRSCVERSWCGSI
jgi:hypothetical protein